MKNKGRITIFLCLLVSSMMLLGLEAIKMIDLYMAQATITMCSRTAVSGIKAEYNSYIFSRYHILLFDKDFGGRGEGCLEELISASMEENLGDGYVVDEVALEDITMLTDDSCGALKEQITEYMGYAVAEYGAEKILAATGGQDGMLPDDILQDLDSVDDADAADVGDYREENDAAGQEANADHKINADQKTDQEQDLDISMQMPDLETGDPRDYTGSLQTTGLLSLVVPKNMTFSEKVLSPEEKPSSHYIGLMGDIFTINNTFDSHNDLITDLKKQSRWKDTLITNGTGTAFSADVFNCATDRSANEDSVLKCEIEYLICGKESDQKNMESVVNRLIAIRLPVNYTYLLHDLKKEKQITELAWSLAFATGVPEPVLKHLLAGAWAYVEAVAEVRNLLEGKRLSFAKNTENWITDLENPEGSVMQEAEEGESGLVYKDYLLILLSGCMDKAYYRMLDLMELNARQEDDSFRIGNAAVAFSVDIHVLHAGRDFFIRETAEY